MMLLFCTAEQHERYTSEQLAIIQQIASEDKHLRKRELSLRIKKLAGKEASHFTRGALTSLYAVYQQARWDAA